MYLSSKHNNSSNNNNMSIPPFPKEFNYWQDFKHVVNNEMPFFNEEAKTFEWRKIPQGTKIVGHTCSRYRSMAY